MLIKKLILGALSSATLLIASCGQFTNFPAQYRIAGNSTLVAVIEYPPVTGTGGSVKVKLPKLVIKGEPGSIGATFDEMILKYNVTDIAQTSLPVSFRIDSSHFRDKDGNVVVDGGSFDLPVVGPKVIDYGKRQGVSNISAIITLNGQDDANWPTSMQINVPIIFLPGASGESSTVTPKP